MAQLSDAANQGQEPPSFALFVSAENEVEDSSVSTVPPTPPTPVPQIDPQEALNEAQCYSSDSEDPDDVIPAPPQVRSPPIDVLE